MTFAEKIEQKRTAIELAARAKEERINSLRAQGEQEAKDFVLAVLVSVLDCERTELDAAATAWITTRGDRIILSSARVSVCPAGYDSMPYQDGTINIPVVFSEEHGGFSLEYPTEVKTYAEKLQDPLRWQKKPVIVLTDNPPPPPLEERKLAPISNERMLADALAQLLQEHGYGFCQGDCR